MTRQIAWVRDGKILEIIPRRAGVDIVRGTSGDDTRLIDVTGRPDLKVGDPFPFGPEPKKEVK